MRDYLILQRSTSSDKNNENNIREILHFIGKYIDFFRIATFLHFLSRLKYHIIKYYPDE